MHSCLSCGADLSGYHWSKTFCPPCVASRRRSKTETPEGEHVCAQCGKDLSQFHKNKKFCPECLERTEKCRKKATNDRQAVRLRGMRLRQITPVTCKHCGVLFTPLRKGRVFCTDDCRDRHHQKIRDAKVKIDASLRAKKNGHKKTAYRKRHDHYVTYQRQYYAENREKAIAANRCWKAANPDKVVAHMDAYRVRRHERLRDQSDGTAPAAVGDLLKQSRCLYCDTQLDSITQKAIDHMQPVALGGLHSACNLALSCVPCNTRKAAQPFIEWIAKLPAKDRARAARYWAGLNGAPPGQLSLPMPVTMPIRQHPAVNQSWQ